MLQKDTATIYQNKYLYRVILVEMAVLVMLMAWFVLTDAMTSDILPGWVTGACLISFVLFLFGMIRQNPTILKISVINASAFLAPFVYTISADAPDSLHRIGSLLLPAAVALLIDGWYWVLGGPAIATIVLINHTGIGWLDTLYPGDYVWFTLVMLMLVTTRVMTDLTLKDLQNRAAALAENAALTEMLTNSVDAGLIVADRNLKVFIWNSRMVSITGVGLEEIKNLPLPKISGFVTGQSSREEQVTEVLNRVLSGETISVPDTMIPFPRVGTNNWYSRTYAPHYNGYHRIVGIVESIRDVTKYHLDAETISNLNNRLINAYDATLMGWVKALDMRDEETEGHSRRVTLWTVRLARAMGVSEVEIENIRRGALLHDIGKLAVPDAILQKPGKLTPQEMGVMRTHPDRGYDMLKGIEYLINSTDIVYSHHEMWDGTGYPKGLKEYAIPLSARLFSIVDVFDALTSDRPYRKAMTEFDALKIIKDGSGKHFDPDIVDLFIKNRVWDDTEWPAMSLR